MKSWPSVCIFISGVMPGRVAEVVAVLAPGQRRARRRLDAADRRVHPAGQLLAEERERQTGEVRPAARAADEQVRRLADLASCSSASSPMTVWCSSTWLSTEPSA